MYFGLFTYSNLDNTIVMVYFPDRADPGALKQPQTEGIRGCAMTLIRHPRPFGESLSLRQAMDRQTDQAA